MASVRSRSRSQKRIHDLQLVSVHGAEIELGLGCDKDITETGSKYRLGDEGID